MIFDPMVLVVMLIVNGTTYIHHTRVIDKWTHLNVSDCEYRAFKLTKEWTRPGVEIIDIDCYPIGR